VVLHNFIVKKQGLMNIHLKFGRIEVFVFFNIDRRVCVVSTWKMHWKNEISIDNTCEKHCTMYNIWKKNLYGFLKVGLLYVLWSIVYAKIIQFQCFFNIKIALIPI